MKNRKLKKGVIYGLYGVAFLSILATIYFIETSSKDKLLDGPVYVEETILENTPVINTSNIITRPYTASNVSIGRSFYDYEDVAENQVNSLIYFEGTYLPNSGVDYKSDEVFEVVSILDGVVTNVSENTLLGKIIEITHENNLISVYQSLSEITVDNNAQVLKGTVIGKSGNANIDVNLGNHLHFEIIHDGTNVNPELYYDKQISEL